MDVELLSKTSLVWDSFGFSNPYSGIYHYGEKLYTELKTFHCEPKILGFQASPPFVQGANFSQLITPSFCKWTPFLKLPAFWASLAYKQHSKGSNSDKPLIWHAHANLNAPFFLQNKNKNIFLVVTIHDIIPLLPASGTSLSLKLQAQVLLPQVLRLADLVLCVSQWTLRHLASSYPRYSQKLLLFPHGWEKKQHGTLLKANEDNKEISLLMVSRYEKYKRFKLLLRIMRKLPEGFFLNLVTDQKGKKYVFERGQDLLQKKTLRVHCNLRGEKLQELYKQADLYLQTSLYEGFCFPAAKALEACLPVVYQGGHGTDEVVKESLGKKLEQNASLSDWVEAVLAAKNLKSESSFREQVDQYLASRPTWNEQAKKLIKIYRALISS